MENYKNVTNGTGDSMSGRDQGRTAGGVFAQLGPGLDFQETARNDFLTRVSANAGSDLWPQGAR
jgi:hypothetical protein